ncbi:chaperonin 10-like protein [Fimicolochytrium jonesii]|uniref:chaperonin 10-like protein n=1 Tax=Fimicolochytrium jonesii TaxID=1396493 RepID=UPI0022FE5678|nr:chaperonin 10-like protein [Fimicolochytrium jonesii]KAI8822173.1 chaperonin 10-like protein [Fimicolochytrium jonesii]
MASTTTDYKFMGWVAKDKESFGNLVWEEYEPKPFTDDDVDIKITHCGICGSDLHTIRSGWGPTLYPAVVGHEIVGTVVKAGTNVKNVSVGDRVGVGAQSDSCHDCSSCKAGQESYCDNGFFGTYNALYKDNSKSYGGYADYARLPAAFAFKIPDAIPSEVAAPLLCGGVTVFSPLKQLNAGPGKRIGIIGIGGLGHLGLLFAKAMGAEPVAISHSSRKKEDADKLGAVQFISTKDDKDFAKTYRRTLDGIVCTANNADMPLYDYMELLKPGGQIILVGLPEEPFPALNIFPLVHNNTSIKGSLIGGSADIKEMLDVAAKANVKTWVETRSMEDANQAVIDMEDGKARYRYVLVNEKHANKL